MRKLMVAVVCLWTVAGYAQKTTIYKKGWIDLNKNGQMDIYEDPSQPIDKRVADLLSRMNLDEKSCQTATLYGYGRVLKDEMPTPGWKNEVWKDGIANIDEELNSLPFDKKAVTQYSFPYSRHAQAINTIQHWFIEETRLGIPVDFTNEGIHGLCHDRATPLPAPISIGATWNRALVRRAGEIVGREARALGYTNVYAPILDPARDPRWGRVVECYGEDPFLIAELGKQMVLGIQSQNAAATLKHYAVYSVPKGGRDGNARTDPHVAPREMHQLYLYPFKRVIREAHPKGVMSSYNDWDGVPVSGSPYFLTTLLRQEYGFDGYVVSDSKAVEFLFQKHHVAADFKDAGRMALEAGLNVWTNFKTPDTYIYNVRALVNEGKLSMATLDKRVGEVLKVKFELGLFDHPFVEDPAVADRIVHKASGDSVEQALTQESMVLLKNTGHLLPLDPQKKQTILVTGPLAAASTYMVSRYGPSNNPLTSVLDGIRREAGNGTTILYEKGCDVTNEGWPETEIISSPMNAREKDSIAVAVRAAANADLIVLVVGEDQTTVGESLSRTSLDLPGRQDSLLRAMVATGKPVVMVMVTGQPLTINWADRYVPSIICAGFPGPSGGTAIARTLFGKYNPGGKLSMTYPKTTGQIEMNFPFKPASQADQPTDGPNGYGKTSVNGVLYPFGFGLSYTSFAYSNLLIKDTLANQEDIEVTVDVQNTGDRDGDEIAQLYVSDLMSSVIAYESQLRGFERIHLKAGEKKTLRFILHPSDLEMLDANMKWTVEPGAFEIRIGASSTDIRQKKTIWVK